MRPPERRGGSREPTIFLSAGEPSGDVHGAALVKALLARWPGARLLGLGGARMAAEGVELLADPSDLSVMGFAEVLSRLPFFLRLRRRIFRLLERERVDLVIPIDYPGFNLRLARHARAQGIPVLYYIAPQVWAWHASRATALARHANRVAVILPFEEPFLREAGADAEYVGHPLLDGSSPRESREAWAERWGLDPERPILALFPGSRKQEVERHLELFAAAAAELQTRLPALLPVIGVAADLPPALFAATKLPRIPSESGVLDHADAALVKSGTTTLEAALAGTPFVVAYRMNPASYWLARRLVRVPHIALANLVADARIVPEFVQGDATPEALSRALLPLLERGTPERQQMLHGLSRVQERLGKGGAAERVAAVAGELLADTG